MFIFVTLAIPIGVYLRLRATNMTVPAGAERKLTEREALRFRLDHNLPI